MKKTILILFSLFTFSIAFTQSGYNLEFSQVKLVGNTTETVPSGKVWKITSLLTNNRQIRYINIDGTSVNMGYHTDGIEISPFPIWLPEGSTLSTGANVYKISLIEFNLISN